MAAVIMFNLPSIGHSFDQIRAPEDLLVFVPQRFLFTGNYNVKLTITEMRIDHMARKSQCPMKKRSCMVSLSYAQPIGQALFSSRFDLPLLSTESLQSSWAMASFGDYVLHLSNTPLYSPSLRLVASVRF